MGHFPSPLPVPTKCKGGKSALELKKIYKTTKAEFGLPRLITVSFEGALLIIKPAVVLYVN